MKDQNNSARMGTAAVPGLLLRLSVPSIMALLINNLYNMVDSIFVAHLNEKALTALSLAAPVQILIAALGSGMAIGLNAVVSRGLGEKNPDMVKESASAGIFLAGCSWILLLLTQALVLEPFFSWQTGDPEIAQYGITYLRICMIFSFGCMLQWVFDRLLIATGKTPYFMISLLSASITNLILDPVLIFGWFGLPSMGIAGAAYATVTGQILGAVVSISLNVFGNKEIPICCTWKPKTAALAQILQVGIPTALMQGMASAAGMLVNMVLIGFSSTAVAVYGIFLKIQNLFLAVPSGINLALVPVVAYNDGAKKPEREKQAFRWALIFSFGFMAAAVVFLEMFPQEVLRVFQASEQMLAMGTTALRILAFSMLFSVYGLILASVLQALGKGVASMILTVARQAVFLLPMLWILQPAGSLELMWAAFPAAEVMGIVMGLWLHRKKYRLFPSAESRKSAVVESAGLTISEIERESFFSHETV